MQTNREIRATAIKNKVRFWQIADRLGIHEGTFTKRLRYEFNTADKTEVLEIIERISKEREEG